MANKKQKMTEYSKEAGNLEVVKKTEESDGKKLSLSKDGFNMGKGTNLYIGSLNINTSLKKRHEKHYKNSTFHLIADLIMAMVIILLLIVVLRLAFWNPKPEIILSSATGNGVVNSAELQTFILDYHTKSRSYDNSLSINLPENFIFVSALPNNTFNSETNTFSLPDLTPGANGQIKITGYVMGETGNQQGIGFTFNCKECAETGVLNSLLYNIEGSAIELSAWAPEIFYTNTETEIEITIKNNSSNDWDKVLFELPKAWLITGDYNIIDNRLVIEDMEANSETTVNLAIIPINKPGQTDLTIDYLLVYNGNELKQGTWTKSVLINEPQLEVNLDGYNKVINTEELAHFSLNYKNLEDDTIKSLTFRLASNDNFKISNLKLTQSNRDFNIADNVILVNNDIQTGETGQVNFSVKLQNLKPEINQNFELKAQANYLLDNKGVNYSVTSNDIKVASDLQAEVKAYYYSPQGDQLGIGPLPPIVDIPTTYWIFLDTENFGNNLTDLAISAQLGANVSWTDKKSVISGDLRYAVGSNKVVWEIKKILAEDKNRSARFAISLVPSSGQINTVPTLLQDIQVTAYDNFTKQNISFSLPNITTELNYDSLASGQSKVQP